MLQIFRHFAAVLFELGDDFFVQPDVQRRRVVLVTVVMQFLSERAARGEAAVEVEHFQKIDNRMFPIEPLVMLRGEARQHGIDIDRAGAAASVVGAGLAGAAWAGSCSGAGVACAVLVAGAVAELP